MIKRLFTPPHFESPEDNFRAKFINGFAWAVIFILAMALLLGSSKFNRSTTNVILVALIAVQGLALYLLRKGKIVISGWILVLLSWVGLTFQAYSADGVKDVVVIAYIAVALLASLIVNWITGGIVIVASIGTIWILALLENNQMIVSRIQDPIQYAIELSLVFGAITALIAFSTNSLRDAIRRAIKSEEGLRTSNRDLQELNQNLEQRVALRTAELELANQRNGRRAQQFEAIAQVARATTTAMEMQELLSRLVEVISQQFGFYHAGIFFIDENREFAVLRAANSEGGKRMLQRGHRLAFGQTGIVGFVAATGTARTALDVGTDAAYFDNPDLPETRSELALPLRSGSEIIGILDVQSKEAGAFQVEDVEVLSTLADQVSIAIQNARSFETTQQLLKEAQKTSGAYLQESWKVLQSQETHTGYSMSGNILKRMSQRVSSPQINKAIASRQTIAEMGETLVLAVPIRLREDVIGVMNIRLLQGHDIDPDEVDIAEAVAERLSLAIETALLLKTTQRRAEIERVTSEISGKVSSTTQFESILRTAAEELSRALGGSEVIVQLQSSDSLDQPNEPSMV